MIRAVHQAESGNMSRISKPQTSGRFSTFASSVYNKLPSFPRVKLDSPANMLDKVQKIAIPAILLAAASGVQGASAIGCFGCVICLAGGGGPLCIPICIVCGVTIPIPLG